MAYTILLHIMNEDPIVGEINELPGSTDTLLTVNNPRKRDGKDLHYLQSNVVTVIWPMDRINFIQVIPGEEEEQIISFVRE